MSFVMKAPEVVEVEVEFTPPGAQEVSSVLVEFKWLSKKDRQNVLKQLQAAGDDFSVAMARYRKQTVIYQDALDAYLDKELAGELNGEQEPEAPAHPEPAKTDFDFARDLVKNIKGLKDEAGEDLNYTPARLKKLMDMDFVAAPFVEHMNDYLRGNSPAKMLQKN